MLQHYWSLTIRLFSVICGIFSGGGFLPLYREAVGVFYSPSRLGNRGEGVLKYIQPARDTSTNIKLTGNGLIVVVVADVEEILSTNKLRSNVFATQYLWIPHRPYQNDQKALECNKDEKAGECHLIWNVWAQNRNAHACTVAGVGFANDWSNLSSFQSREEIEGEKNYVGTCAHLLGVCICMFPHMRKHVH